VNTFYYWVKRLRSPAVAASLLGPHGQRERGRQSVQHTSGAVGNSNAALVRFHWNAAVEVSVPANCLDAIRCLAECLQHAHVDRSGAFQEVVVSS
jgi:hypothetical protein